MTDTEIDISSLEYEIKPKDIKDNKVPEHCNLTYLVFDDQKYPHLSSLHSSASIRREECEKYYTRNLERKRQWAHASKAINPIDPRFYLISNSEMLAALQEIIDEIMFTIGCFVEYLILPQSKVTGPVRDGYFQICKENIIDGYIQSPSIGKEMVEYLLQKVLPYEPICKDYEPESVADIGPIPIEKYDVQIEGDIFHIEPMIFFTDESLDSIITLSKQTKTILRNIGIVNLLSKEGANAIRDFACRLIRAFRFYVSEGSNATIYLQFISQLQSQSWIVRGVEMDRDEKLQNALSWLITAGTDWLSKRDVDLYDVAFAIRVLLGSSGIDYLNRVLTFPKINLNDPHYVQSLQPLQQYYYKQHLIVPIFIVGYIQQAINYMLSQPDIISWIDERLNTFAQL
jgi:hypothetical protein